MLAPVLGLTVVCVWNIIPARWCNWTKLFLFAAIALVLVPAHVRAVSQEKKKWGEGGRLHLAI